MSKFNVGDRVVNTISDNLYTIIGINGSLLEFKRHKGKWWDSKDYELVEPALTIDKVTEWLSDNGYYYTISSKFFDEMYMSKDCAVSEPNILEPEFEWGEEVEVRHGINEKWRKRKYVGINPITGEHIGITSDGKPYNFSLCRKPKTKVTLDEIAEWKGVDKDRIEIE